MNATNAVIFGAFGSLMEFLPRAFPTLFPHCGGGEWSIRAMWLFVMGAVHLSIGAGYILRFNLVPAVGRLLPSSGVEEAGTLALPVARGLTSR